MYVLHLVHIDMSANKPMTKNEPMELSADYPTDTVMVTRTHGTFSRLPNGHSYGYVNPCNFQPTTQWTQLWLREPMELSADYPMDTVMVT